MRRVITLLAFALAIGIAGSPASADYRGCWLGAGVGMSATNNTTDIVSDGTVLPVGNLVTIGGLGSSGRLGAISAGCDYRMEKFVIGVIGDYTWHNEKFEVTSSLLPGSLLSMEMNNSWTIGGRAGVVFDKALVYGLVGYSKLETSGITVPAANLTLAYPSFTGWTFGGGIEVPIVDNLRIGIEYRYTLYDAETAPIGMGSGLSVNLQPEMQTVQARLSYGFNFSK